MSICMACGEVELLFVPACGDESIGHANVLLFAQTALEELNAEEKLMHTAFNELMALREEAAPPEIIEQKEHLAKMLEKYIKPNVKFPSKHLVQAYRISAKRWTFVRSDKIKNHWRSYKMDKNLLEAQKRGDKAQLNRAGLRDAFKQVRDGVAKDLKDGIAFKGEIIKGSASGSIADIAKYFDLEANWLKWVDDVNDSLLASGSSAYHDLSAGAQLLRGYAGYGGFIGYNHKTGKFGLSGHANAKFALAEASGKFNGYLPHRDGWHAMIGYATGKASQAGKQKNLDFGYFRFNIEMTADAMVGASIMGTAEISFTAQPDGTVKAKGGAEGSKAEVAAGAFVGVEAGAGVKGSLEWDNPESRVGSGKHGWAPMVSIGVKVSGNLGAGLSGELKITFEGGRLMFRCQAQVVIGLGGKGALVGVIGFGTITDFIMYVYHQLKDNDFSYLEFMEEDAFNFVTGLILYTIEHDIDALIAIGELVDGVADLAGDAAKELVNFVSGVQAGIKHSITNANAAEAFAKKIKAKPDVLFFATPEAKGAILYRLSERFAFSFEEHQEAAILTVMGTIQTQIEWDKVVCRISMNGAKSTEVAGLNRLNAVLDGGSQRLFDKALLEIKQLPAHSPVVGVPVDRSLMGFPPIISRLA